MNRYISYKDSGLEWIGEIPSSWSLKRVGDYFSERRQTVDDKTFPPLSVTMNGIVDQLEDVAKTDNTDNRKLVREGDFVINSRSDRKGSSGLSKRDGSVSVINIVLGPRQIIPTYAEYLFKSYYFKEEFFRNGKGIHWDLWSTRWDQLKSIVIPVPNQNTQTEIANYLDEKTTQIDSLIEKSERKIELLKEYRQSLISNVVTGKVRVVEEVA
jgi:type I restriction enzyme S subunit|tara:strand:+ start:790 stop:1425 length:636 start_codon:yes stop_codon:yes gene_type:complete